MRWNDFLTRFSDMPLFHSSMLGVFSEDRKAIQVQLSRWVKAGRVVRLRRTWYLIEKPWRTKDVPLSYIATQIVQPSYLSLEWALGRHGLIPEAVQNPTSVTTDRPRRVSALGRMFLYYHIRPSLLTGFSQISAEGWQAPLASSEKALFDMIYFRLQRHRFSRDWLAGLRLQNLKTFNIPAFLSYADKSSKRGLRSALLATADEIRKMRTER